MTDLTRAEQRLERRLLELAKLGDLKGIERELERWKQSRCGAKTTTRGGAACRAASLANGRCKMHAGLATGPTSRAGRLKALLNLRPFQHLRSVPREQAEAELRHLLDRPVRRPSRRPPKAKPRERSPDLIQTMRLLAELL